MPLDNLPILLDPAADLATLAAYLDPGTGSYALQLLLAGAFGGLFALKQSWQQCRAWFAQVIVRRPTGPTKLDAAD